ncbi:hypothetical protein Q5H91_09040 [Sphingomonas sp. KR1UV-12]|uniref:DUF11 domain-containing protein n=1 Tax=Sphingomonas aurea TaxID=3063994 RepID=A0ABT9EK65_9SPHN|nr:hypothetical protein [Sphingomonas sp. KR1UV-12]MDP1027357.1 hypothetical protein [Sphingomonas sp. KR1UV-12]
MTRRPLATIHQGNRQMFAKKAVAALLTGTAAIGAAGAAQAQTTTPAAQTTAAGTVISNTASVSYTVNGTAQTTNSTTASFVVDRKVNFTVVTDQSGYTQVNLNQQNAVTTFRVTNLTNGTQDFLLDADQPGLLTGLLIGTDNFDMLNLRVFADSNNNGVYDPGVDTQTYIDELAPDASVAVFVVGNVPNLPSASIAWDSLHVTAAAGGATGTKGAALIATDLNLGNADNTVDIVFADDDSDGALNLGDIARNGQGRAYSGYQVGVRNVALTVSKSARILSDGVNTLNPKAIPGATVEYCLLVNNATTTTPATAVALTDVVPANTTYVAGSISIGTPGLLGVACVVNGSTEDDDADDAAETDGLTASFDTATKTVTANVGDVAGGGRIAASFRVTIN